MKLTATQRSLLSYDNNGLSCDFFHKYTLVSIKFSRLNQIRFVSYDIYKRLCAQNSENSFSALMAE